MKTADKPLTRALKGKALKHPPIWLMRQAGRYLPEYREVRARAGSFLDLCYNPALATEVTLQPIRRFGFDAAILFSDILVVADALGQSVAFEEGRGPVLEPLQTGKDLAKLKLDRFHDRLAPVYETLDRIKAALPAETALIGFAGAPWTVASYMIEGGSSRDFAKVKGWMHGQITEFAALIDLLVEATSQYLIRQVEAGAEVLQLFDSWAGALSHPDMRQFSLAPLRKIVANVRAKHPNVPIILFPRAVGAGYLDFAVEKFAQGLSLDPGVPLEWARDHLQSQTCLQGNLDPQLLVIGGRSMNAGVARILHRLGKGPFIFNLGHGIVPETPPEHVAELVKLVREGAG
ncbi:uroporphyrinogen decarboxylase [Dongia deserti]|uniref:uroporphyrinogen decarboxylase n=1 Tax=Dongia deserti TaxID=2268030 RepID=UPI000E655B6B|nr:uroporphyrinogen decarboxylase [Dongia deserti]